MSFKSLKSKMLSASDIIEFIIMLNDNVNADINTKSPKLLKLLIDKGVNINYVDCFGRTALFYTSDPRIVEILIKNDINVNIKNKNGDSYLEMLCSSYWCPYLYNTHRIIEYLVLNVENLIISDKAIDRYINNKTPCVYDKYIHDLLLNNQIKSVSKSASKRNC